MRRFMTALFGVSLIFTSGLVDAKQFVPKALSQTNSRAGSSVQRSALFFTQLRKNFAQQSATDEDAYTELAQKLL